MLGGLLNPETLGNGDAEVLGVGDVDDELDPELLHPANPIPRAAVRPTPTARIRMERV